MVNEQPARSQRPATPPQAAAQATTQAPASIPPVTEVDQLKATVASLSAKLDSLVNAQLQSSNGPQRATQQQIVLPASELIRQQQEAKRKAKDDAFRAGREKADRDLLAGPQQFEVSLSGNPKRIVGARDDIEAKSKYMRYFGIKSTSHEVIARDLSAAA